MEALDYRYADESLLREKLDASDFAGVLKDIHGEFTNSYDEFLDFCEPFLKMWIVLERSGYTFAMKYQRHSRE